VIVPIPVAEQRRLLQEAPVEPLDGEHAFPFIGEARCAGRRPAGNRHGLSELFVMSRDLASLCDLIQSVPFALIQKTEL